MRDVTCEEKEIEGMEERDEGQGLKIERGEG